MAELLNGMTPDLGQIRTFVAVAERHSFTRAAEDLHIAQQAVSQQVKSLEKLLGVTLLLRDSRSVVLTPEGAVFFADCSRLLAMADASVARVRAAAQGDVGTLRLAYTLTTAYETVPALLERLEATVEDLKVRAREVFGGDIPAMLETGAFDLALAPITSYPEGISRQALRRERLQLAVSQTKFTSPGPLLLSSLSERRFEIWPREMAPGFYDAVTGACRAAGFEPQLDVQGAGNTVWGYIADGRGVGLTVASLKEQLPQGVKLLDLASPVPMLTFEVVWREDSRSAATDRFLAVAGELAAERVWL